MTKWIKIENTYFNLEKIETFEIKQLTKDAFLVEISCVSGHKVMINTNSYTKAEEYITNFIAEHYKDN